MGKINLGKKLTAILCVVLCCVQTTGCDKKAAKEQAAQIAQGAKDAAAEKVDAYLESCTESDSESEVYKPSMKDEPEIYERAVDDFFAAVDSGDKEKILAQFAPNVRKNNKDLEENLDELLSFYPGPTDRCERDGNVVEGNYDQEYGIDRYNALSWFAVVSGGTTYYCKFSYVYRDDADPDNVGIEFVDMVSEKVICAENFKWPEEPGIFVKEDAPGDYETARIGGNPVIYVPVERKHTLTKEDVEAFLKTGGNFTDFKEQFGEPNAEEIKYSSYAYELPEENSEKRYVSFLVDHKKDWEILRVTIEEETGIVETLYRSPELD